MGAIERMGPEGVEFVSRIKGHCVVGEPDYAASSYVDALYKLTQLQKGRFFKIPEAARLSPDALTCVKGTLSRLGVTIPEGALERALMIRNAVPAVVKSATKLPVGKIVGVAAAGLGVGLMAAGQGVEEYAKTKNLVRSATVGAVAAGSAVAGGIAGAEIGAAAGGGLGTLVFPVVGTVTGAAACGLVGGIVGSVAGEEAVTAATRAIFNKMEGH
jgi:hypothetical protein